MTEPAARFFRPLAREPVGPHNHLATEGKVFVHATKQPLLDALMHLEQEAQAQGTLGAKERTALVSMRGGSRLLDSAKGRALVGLAARLPEEQRRAFWRETMVHLTVPSAKTIEGPTRRLLNGGPEDLDAIDAFLHRRKGSEVTYYFHGSRGTPGSLEMFIKRHRDELLGMEQGKQTLANDELAREIREEADALLAALDKIKEEMPHEKPTTPPPAKPGPKKPLSMRYPPRDLRRPPV